MKLETYFNNETLLETSTISSVNLGNEISNMDVADIIGRFILLLLSIFVCSMTIVLPSVANIICMICGSDGGGPKDQGFYCSLFYLFVLFEIPLIMYYCSTNFELWSPASLGIFLGNFVLIVISNMIYSFIVVKLWDIGVLK